VTSATGNQMRYGFLSAVISKVGRYKFQ